MRVGALAVVVTVTLAGTVAASRFVPHPVGPARDFAGYERKAVTTAESALSEVGTVVLVAGAASQGDTFGPYTAVVLSDAEEALGGLAGTFESIQPSGPQADRLADDLSAVLSDAADHARDVRVAARRGSLPGLAELSEPLDGDAERLRRFIEDHE